MTSSFIKRNKMLTEKGKIPDDFEDIYLLYFSKMKHFAQEYVVSEEDALKKQFVDSQNMHALLNLSEHAEGNEEARFGYERFIRQNRNRKMFKLIR